MDTKHKEISSHAISQATELWAIVRMFEENKVHVPPASLSWDELNDLIGLSGELKRKMLQRIRERLSRDVIHSKNND